MEKLKIEKPILVEGRYDQNKLRSVADAQILRTEGFGVFRDREKKELICRLAQKAGGIIVLTDSDGAGLVIRNYINGILKKELITHLYIPQITGKERRKDAPSKEGLLGVEGMEAALLRQLLSPYAGEGTPRAGMALTKADFFSDGLSGTPNSARRRALLCREASLPQNLSANALLEALNLLYTEPEYRALLDRVNALLTAEEETK